MHVPWRSAYMIAALVAAIGGGLVGALDLGVPGMYGSVLLAGLTLAVLTSRTDEPVDSDPPS